MRAVAFWTVTVLLILAIEAHCAYRSLWPKRRQP